MISPERIEAALGATTEDTPQGLQYVLIRGLHAMGYEQPTIAAEDLVAAAIAAADAKAWQPIETMPRDGETYIIVAPSPVPGLPMSCIRAVKPLSPTALTSDELRKLGVKWWRPQPPLPAAPGER